MILPAAESSGRLGLMAGYGFLWYFLVNSKGPGISHADMSFPDYEFRCMSSRRERKRHVEREGCWWGMSSLDSTWIAGEIWRGKECLASNPTTTL
jgi:hypothetical protein